MTNYEYLMSLIGTDIQECILWDRGVTPTGYGCLWHQGKTRRAPRLLLLSIEKPSDPSLHCAHECGVRLCVNPNHLTWKTRSQNMLDKNRHGTIPVGEATGKNILTADQVKEIKKIIEKRRQARAFTNEVIAEKYGVAKGTISNIAMGRTWADV